MLVKDAVIAQKSIMEFGQTGINIPRRWDYAGTRKTGSFITPR